MENHEEQFVNAGKILVNTLPGEEIVITGVAGCFPKSNNISQFLENLYKKTDLLSEIPEKWRIVQDQVPLRVGKLNTLEKFDAGFFGIHHQQAEAMDAGCRKLLEQSIEAVIDSGLNPNDLQGANTGVFIGTALQETEKFWLYDNLKSPNFGFTGSTRTMVAQWISYHLGLQGPSIVMDSACSASLYALEHAFRAIRTGRCDSALVGGVNLILNCNVLIQFLKLGPLDREAKNFVFDESSNGFVRSEGISIVFLQKVKNAKKVYAQIIHAKTNCDGYKEIGITHPSGEAQAELFGDVYKELGVNPSSVEFIEAHATGTKAGDPQEFEAIESVFCKDRQNPLLVGSVKSNLGHCETTSGLSSLIKVLGGMLKDCILPNINYVNARKDIASLQNGKITVVTDFKPLKDIDYFIGINNFGFGGANAHAVIKPYRKHSHIKQFSGINRLVCASSRTSNALTELLDSITSSQTTEEYLGLLQNIFRKKIVGHWYRGYVIISKNGILRRSFKLVPKLRKPLCIVFSGICYNWFGMYEELLKIPIFSNIMQKITSIMLSKGEDILNNATGAQRALIGSVAVQIALLDTLRFLEIPLHHFLGWSMGYLTSVYADGTFTLEQTLSMAYVFSCRSFHNSTKIDEELLQELRTIIDTQNGGHVAHAHEISAENLYERVMEQAASDHGAEKLPRRAVTLIIIGQYQGYSFQPSASIYDTDSLLQVLGSVYENGFNPNIGKLYNAPPYPIKAPPISPLIKWDHTEDWFVYSYNSNSKCGTDIHTISMEYGKSDWEFLLGHIIDGKNLLPAAAYIYIVWQTYTNMFDLIMSETKVEFENVKFHRNCVISKASSLSLMVQISNVSGTFEVTQMDQLLVSGKIHFPKCNLHNFLNTSDNTDGIIGNDATYRLLHLQKYTYLNDFCQIQAINHFGTNALIKWNSNWITFLDNMMQMELIRNYGANLVQPVLIERLSIDPQRHLKPNESSVVPVVLNKCSNVIESEGIEIRNVLMASLLRREMLDQPILQSYAFVPFTGKMSSDNCVRVVTKLILENIRGECLRLTEVVDEFTNKNTKPLALIIEQLMLEEALVESDIVIFSDKTINSQCVKVVNRSIEEVDQESDLVIVSAILERPTVLHELMDNLCDGAFVLSREHEDSQMDNLKGVPDVQAISVNETGRELLVLLRKTKYKERTVVHVDNGVNWLRPLQSAIANNDNILVVSQNQPVSGVLGFINCLKLEVGNTGISCVFIMDSEPIFTVDDVFCSNQIKKNLTINVLRNGEWGTYRHLPLKESISRSKHIIGSVKKGDATSFQWIQGSYLSEEVLESNEIFAQVCSVGLNFRDVMVASGEIIPSCTLETRECECADLGMEFAGRNFRGERIMGLVKEAGLSSVVKYNECMTWKIPNNWTMDDAATVPVTFSTILYALITVGRLQSGQSVLIHAGAGGIGQSAISVCLYYKCNIFVTVGSETKRNVLKGLYPSLKDNRIGNSRDVSFEQLVMKETNGKGLDVIVNSLAEEKLQASIRCLSKGGKFLEIGKLNGIKNNCIQLELISSGRSFFGINLDAMFDKDAYLREKVVPLVTRGIEVGYVKPLPRIIFENGQVKYALHYLATGKNIGKVVVKIINDEVNQAIVPELQMFEAIPRFYCNSMKVYIIVGGLGGFGLELTNWLIRRGAKKLMLVSRRKTTNDYQNFEISKWRNFGATVVVARNDLSTIKGCEELISDATELGAVDGIFNLAVILNDALFENQTEQSFAMVFGPKAVVTKNLDVASRKLCPDLRLFVAFSSWSCGKGNAGQTNYSMANSIMERICEVRKSEGYPALAIQWGPIGDVGVLAHTGSLHTNVNVAGCKQQSILSCLGVLDAILTQQETITSSTVTAEKTKGISKSIDLFTVISDVMGISLQHTSHHSTLANLGLDSMSSVVLQRVLKNQFGTSLSLKNLREMTLHRLSEQVHGFL